MNIESEPIKDVQPHLLMCRGGKTFYVPLIEVSEVGRLCDSVAADSVSKVVMVIHGHPTPLIDPATYLGTKADAGNFFILRRRAPIIGIIVDDILAIEPIEVSKRLVSLETHIEGYFPRAGESIPILRLSAFEECS